MAPRAGRRRLRLPRRPGLVVAALVVALILCLVFGRSAAIFYTDALWFDAVGQSAVFWTRFVAGLIARLVTGAFGAAIILANLWFVLRQLGPVHLRRRYGNIEIAEQVPRSYLITGSVLVALLAGWWLSNLQFGGNAAIELLAWARSEPWGVVDPLFGRDVSFYIFGLPMYRRLLEYLLIVIVWSIMLVAIGYALIGAVRVSGTRWEIDERPRVHFAVLVAVLLAVLGARYLFGRYLLLLDGTGFREAIGYTDVNARLPARLVVGLLAFAAAGSLVYGAVKRTWAPPVAAVGVFLVAAVGMGIAWPAIVQRVTVEANQLEREREYIRWNMEFTRRAFGIDQIDRRRFTYRRPGSDVWTDLAPVLERLPLWDQEQLRIAFTQMEARKGYYRFPDVDFDRYGMPGDRSQIAVGVREIAQDSMREGSNTWQNVHLNPLYTRGIGLVAVSTTDVLEGEPVYWLSDVSPVRRHAAAPAELVLNDPSIYFGETTTEYAVVGHRATFNSEDTIARLPPLPRVSTGVPLDSYIRVVAFAWSFGEWNLLFSRELGDSSRILFRRAVRERVVTLAPFLKWDSDPHPIVIDGHVVWILDGYTASSNYPLARPYEIDGTVLRYLHGSVKATLDAVTGEVHMYALPDPDPILQTYRRIFTGLIQDWSAMPEPIRAHVRYPAQLFRIQADVLEDFHLERVDAFYAGQDAWQLPQESSPGQRGRAVYTLAAVPGQREAELLLMQTFIASERQNMTALLIGRSDPPHYGELRLLELPRDDQIKGPAQIQSIIEAEPVISAQLTLLRGQGSDATLGRLRILPTDSSILYIEPVFISSVDNAIPQLQFVIASDGTSVAMADDLDAAVAALGGDLRLARRTVSDTVATARPAGADWTRRAIDLMRRAEERLRAGDFSGFGTAWNELKVLLERASGTKTP